MENDDYFGIGLAAGVHCANEPKALCALGVRSAPSPCASLYRNVERENKSPSKPSVCCSTSPITQRQDTPDRRNTAATAQTDQLGFRSHRQFRKKWVKCPQSVAFASLVEALQRLVERESLRRVHECAFAVLVAESEVGSHLSEKRTQAPKTTRQTGKTREHGKRLLQRSLSEKIPRGCLK